MHASKNQEIVCVVGRVGKLQRQVVVFVVYIPPSYKSADVTAVSDALVHEIAAVKTCIKDPVVFVCGD